MQDMLYHLSLLDGAARAILVDSTGLCERAREIHTLSRLATAALGRVLTQTVILGCLCKNERDSVTVRLTGDGPLGTLLAVGKPDGSVKGYVDDPAVDLPRVNGKLPVGDAVGHTGKLTVIKDLGLREPYVGQVNLVSGEIAEDFAMYFTASEQTPSLVSLGVLTKEHVVAAAGLNVQMLPGSGEDEIRAVEACAPGFVNLSATMDECRLDGAVEKLLGALKPVTLEKREVRYQCDCSRERVERALISLGREELRSMIDTEHGAEVDCHFCNARRRFTGEELEELLRKATR